MRVAREDDEKTNQNSNFPPNKSHLIHSNLFPTPTNERKIVAKAIATACNYESLAAVRSRMSTIPTTRGCQWRWLFMSIKMCLRGTAYDAQSFKYMKNRVKNQIIPFSGA